MHQVLVAISQGWCLQPWLVGSHDGLTYQKFMITADLCFLYIVLVTCYLVGAVTMMYKSALWIVVQCARIEHTLLFPGWGLVATLGSCNICAHWALGSELAIGFGKAARVCYHHKAGQHTRCLATWSNWQLHLSCLTWRKLIYHVDTLANVLRS